MKGREICVIGAGIGGLAVALALAGRGARVRVLERAPEIREVGAGIQISPNGHVVLRALGLEREFDEIALRAGAVRLVNGMNGREVFRLDLARLAAAQRYGFVHRADLLQLLEGAARAAGVQIEPGREVAEVVPHASRPQVLCTDGEWLEADLVIGADGLHSRVRAALNGADKPFFTRQVAWRALVPVVAGRQEPQASVYMGTGHHLVTYPLRGGRVMNIVAVQERDSWADEGWFHKDDPANLRRAFRGFVSDVQRLLAAVEDVYLWGLFRHPVAARWQGGRVALLGDAAHPTLPFLAQGANLALEDAWVLAACLTGAGDPAEGLAAYQARRYDRVVKVIETANSNARHYHMAATPLRFAAHGALWIGSRVAPALALKKFDWLYGHDVTDAEAG